MPSTLYDFEWDTKKARTNLKKHRVSFRRAASVFRDPQALTIFDDEHSLNDERWVSIGLAENGQMLVVVHTSEWIGPATVKIRIISARKAVQEEIRDYETAPH